MPDQEVLNRVRHVVEVKPARLGEWPRGNSRKINDYQSIDGWVLLETETADQGYTGGPYAYFWVGWIGEGEPQIPQIPDRFSSPDLSDH